MSSKCSLNIPEDELKEIKRIMFDRKCDELAIERGLKIKEYPGKWKDAKDMALRASKDKYPEESAFELACRIFLELGGESSANYYGLLNSETVVE